MSKIAGELNAEMMHPKVIHEQRKAMFAEMVRKTGSQQSVLDRLVQEIQFLRDQLAAAQAERDKLLAALVSVHESAVCFAKNEYAISADALNKVENCISSAATAKEQ